VRRRWQVRAWTEGWLDSDNTEQTPKFKEGDSNGPTVATVAGPSTFVRLVPAVAGRSAVQGVLMSRG
jgi:hypothetical protein